VALIGGLSTGTTSLYGTGLDFSSIFVRRHGYYDVEDLQVFNQGRQGGRYWYSRGINWRAMAAWIPATALGLLTANTPVIVGPLHGIAGGIDISLVCTLCTAAVAYPVLTRIFPEPPEVFGPTVARSPAEVAEA